MPAPMSHESLKHYTKRFMSSPEAIRDYPDVKNRYAVMINWFKERKSKASFVVRGVTEEDDEYYGLDPCSAYTDDMKEMVEKGDMGII